MVSLTGAQIPLTGAQYDLSAGDFTATITELGAGLRRLEHRGQPVIVGYEPDVLPPGSAPGRTGWTAATTPSTVGTTS
jgi:aldose 1-epimerase